VLRLVYTRVALVCGPRERAVIHFTHTTVALFSGRAVSHATYPTVAVIRGARGRAVSHVTHMTASCHA